jgi:spore germination cell wall hydrolase CwlJ-like protein
MKPIIFLAMSVMSLFMDLRPDFEPGAFFVQSDIDLMARVVMSEASTQAFECKQAVAATILNRYYSEEFPNDISRVIKGQYSTQDNGKPNEDCYAAVYATIAYRDAFPHNLYYFRNDYYHGFATDYTQIDDLYFSTKGEAHYD